MKLNDFLSLMDQIAPLSLAWERDNPGLLLGTDKSEIRKVMLALDCTLGTAKEAIDWGADLLLTHHPLFWEPVRRILPDTPDTAAAYLLLRNGVALYASHTNLDAAPDGVNDQLARLVGLEEISPLPPEMLGRIGTLPGERTLSDFSTLVEKALQTQVRCCGHANAIVRKVAVVGGSGGGELQDVLHAGADTLLTGELKHDQAIWAMQAGVNVIAAGHYESERIVLAPLAKRLQGLTDDVQYKVARFETSCLRRL